MLACTEDHLDRDDHAATAHLKDRAEKIRANPEAHLPKLILSQHVRGTSILDRIADAVNKFCSCLS